MKHSSILIIASLLLLGCETNHTENLTLHYNRPAEFFEEALPIGNGRLGAMIYGGTDQERISLNDITLWTGEPESNSQIPADYDPIAAVQAVRDALDAEDYRLADRLQRPIQGHFSENYQPLGTLMIHYPEAVITDYYRDLNISDAIASVSYKRDGVPFSSEYFASAPDSVIVVRIRSGKPLDITLTPSSLLPHQVSAVGNRLMVDGYAAYHSLPEYYNARDKFQYDPNRGIHFRTVYVVQTDGQVTAQDSTLKLQGASDIVIKIVNSTSFNGFDRDPVLEGLPYKDLADAVADRVSARDYESIRTAHIADYKTYFDRLSINLGKTDPAIKALPTDEQLKLYTDQNQANPELEALYFQYGRYLLISSSRTPGIPANLQGLWNESLLPPWSSNYTVNINLQENYWPANTAALPEMHQVMLDFIDNMAVSGRATAQDRLGISSGWAAGHNTDIWAMSTPVGLNTGDPCWANWYMSGAWLVTHIWEQYLFTRDLERLKTDYPTLKGAAEFCLEWMVEKDGELITSPSTSPENKFVTDRGVRGATLYGATADLAMIRECLTDAAKAARLFSDTEFADRAEKAISKLRPFKIAADGHLQEWYYDWADMDPQHRHQSHLFGVYPGHQILPGSPEANAALKSLEIKGFETTGWSCGWRVNIYARLGDGESAYRMYRRLLQYVSPDNYRGPDARRGGGTYPNLLDAHSPFQIDGNFGGCAGVIEMLIQSTEDGITKLPALPSAWPKGYIKGVRTRTGQTVDIKWKNGKLKN